MFRWMWDLHTQANMWKKYSRVKNSTKVLRFMKWKRGNIFKEILVNIFIKNNDGIEK